MRSITLSLCSSTQAKERVQSGLTRASGMIDPRNVTERITPVIKRICAPVNNVVAGPILEIDLGFVL